MNWMTIADTGIAVAFSVLNEEWAQKNHRQSLAMLASRGGLDVSEALAIIERRPWRGLRPGEEQSALCDLVTTVYLKTKPEHLR